MNLLSLFSIVVFAAETILSPLPDEQPFATQNISKPTMTFAQLPVPEVLSATIEEPQPLAKQDLAPQETPSPRHARKDAYTIAVIGDSMVDTLGPGVPHLAAELKRIYHNTSFTILNYGVGGTNIDYGLERLLSTYQYLGTNIPALVSTYPDLVVIESFGYNPYIVDEGALDRHWLQLSHMVDTLRAYVPGVKIVIAATIAPDAKTFGDGALAWDSEGKTRKTTTIKSYLENAVRFALSQHLPLADAYHPSRDGNGDGKEEFINQGDHIHYSDQGREFFSQKIADTIVNNKLLE